MIRLLDYVLLGSVSSRVCPLLTLILIVGLLLLLHCLLFLVAAISPLKQRGRHGIRVFFAADPFITYLTLVLHHGDDESMMCRG